MTWHLKDRELERVLEKYSDGNFVKALNFAIERDLIDAANVVTVEFERKFLSRGYTNDLSFRTDELEDIPEYNPNAWNEYPKVTPPEGVLMRVEARTLDDYGERLIVKFYGATYVDGAWRSSVEIEYPETLQIFRFRPWKE